MKLWLQANSWTDVVVGSRQIRTRGRGREAAASFIFRGKHSKGANACHSLDADLDNGSTVRIEIVPWRPAPKEQKVVNLKNRGVSYEPPAGDITWAKIESSDVATKRAAARASSEVAAGRGRSRSPPPKDGPQPEVLDRLGLTVQSVPKDGACFFHAMAKHFKLAARTPNTAGALRTELVNYLKEQRDLIEPFWDRLDSKGRACATWKDYLADLTRGDAWAGELDGMALARKHGLRIVIVRPGLPTVILGDGKAVVWLLYRNNHYEPLVANTDATASSARRQHIIEVTDNYRLTALSSHVRSWAIKGGGSDTSFGSLRPAVPAPSVTASVQAPSCGTLRAPAPSAAASVQPSSCGTLRAPVVLRAVKPNSQISTPNAQASASGQASPCATLRATIERRPVQDEMGSASRHARGRVRSTISLSINTLRPVAFQQFKAPGKRLRYKQSPPVEGVTCDDPMPRKRLRGKQSCPNDLFSKCGAVPVAINRRSNTRCYEPVAPSAHIPADALHEKVGKLCRADADGKAALFQAAARGNKWICSPTKVPGAAHGIVWQCSKCKMKASHVSRLVCPIQRFCMWCLCRSCYFGQGAYAIFC